MTEKVVRNGRVAVLVSPGFGAGWSTWSRDTDSVEQCLFDPETVAWVEGGMVDSRPDFKAKFGEDFYDGGASDLVIQWIPVGTQFRIEEYDGSESLWTADEYKWFTA